MLSIPVQRRHLNTLEEAIMQPRMKLTIVAATGRVGQLAVRQGVAAGHDVTAVVRDPTNLSAAVPVFIVDLAAADPAALESAVDGADAILSALGPRSNAEAGIASHGTRTIVEAMKATDVRRLVAVSSAAISTVPSPGHPSPPKHDPGNGFFMRHLVFPLLKAALRKQYADLALMEDVVRDSGLDWTVVRPNRLTDNETTGSYRTANGQNVRRGRSISRGDVAHLMLRVLEQPDTIKQMIAIAH
jgi:putative NADH-flavin reductase